MIHKHHRKRRSQGGDDSPENIIELEDWVHEAVHRNVTLAIEYGLLVNSWDDPAEIPCGEVDVQSFLAALGGRIPVGTGSPQGAEEPMQTTVDGDEVAHRHVVGDQGVEKVCPKCHGDGKIIVKAKPAAEKKERGEESPIYNARTPKGHSREVLEDDEEHLTDLLVKAGVIRGHQGARWWVIHYTFRFALQNARAFINEFKGEGA